MLPCIIFVICGTEALPRPHFSPLLCWSWNTCCLVTCSTSVKINSANRLWNCLSCVLQPSSAAVSKQLCLNEGSNDTTVPPLTPFQPEWPGSNEVFLLFARGLVRQVLVRVLAGGQFPRRPVGSLVVTEIPVQQEGQNGYRQHNDDNDHWKTYNVDVWDRWLFHKVIYDESCSRRKSYRLQLQDQKSLEQLLSLLKEERHFFLIDCIVFTVNTSLKLTRGGCFNKELPTKHDIYT